MFLFFFHSNLFSEMMFKFLLAAVTIASVAAGDDATCAATDAAKPKWSTVSNECLAAATDDTTCAAIDAAKSKWLQSSTSCVACIIPASPDGPHLNIQGCGGLPLGRKCGCFVTGCTGKVCGQTLGDGMGKVNGNDPSQFLFVQPQVPFENARFPIDTTGTVCSKATPNTCVAPAKDDASCAAIDPAFPLLSLFAKRMSLFPTAHVCVAIPKDDATCAHYNGPSIVGGGMGDAEINFGTGTWSTVYKKCVQTPIDDATCAAFDAAKPTFTNPKMFKPDVYCGDGSPPITDGAKMCGVGTTYDKTKKKCETILPTDIELAKTCGEGTKYDKAKKKCVTDPTSDIELAKMCGEGTMYDKAKKKCVTNPTSRCTPGLTNTTTDKSAAADESAGSSRFVSHTATLTATVIIVLFYKL